MCLIGSWKTYYARVLRQQKTYALEVCYVLAGFETIFRLRTCNCACHICHILCLKCSCIHEPEFRNGISTNLGNVGLRRAGQNYKVGPVFMCCKMLYASTCAKYTVESCYTSPFEARYKASYASTFWRPSLEPWQVSRLVGKRYGAAMAAKETA